jgi:tRNA modification GTPase
MGDQDPIVALSSGKDAAAIAILRVTGEGCHTLLQTCLFTQSEWKARTLLLCEFRDETGTVLDVPMVAFFYGPASYTGQDGAEIFLHGSPYLVRKCLETLYKAGFRQATGGEFTRRAFLNGKMDLTTAEGIDALVHSVSEQQWMAAQQLTSGKLHTTVGELRKSLLQTLALLNAMIDFPDEEETSRLQLAGVLPSIRQTQQRMETLVKSYQSGTISRNGLKIAIVGPPNAGKSTLLNTLLQYERAIISPEAGTTRDFLEESLLLEGRIIRLIDTAGIRDTEETIESIGIERSYAQARQADVVLFLFPIDTYSQEAPPLQEWIDAIQPSAYLPLLTKRDLGTPTWDATDWLSISCETEAGISALQAKLIHLVDFHVGRSREADCFISNQRHLHALQEAKKNVDTYLSAWQSEGEETLAFEIQEAVSHLEEIIGKITPDNLLDVIFSQFCIGK